MKYKDFFTKTDIKITNENIAYVDYLEQILFDNSYETFLLFDKLDTKIIRAYYKENGEKKNSQKEIHEILGINNYQALEEIDFFKKNIEELDIDNEIKRMAKENKINTIEQLIMNNTIKWNNELIRTIKKVLEL